MSHELDEIRSECLKIRSAILKIKMDTLLFKEFPLGCCSISSLVIANILSEKGFRNIYYCHKDCDKDGKSHAWLEYAYHIIDITADQFKNNFDSVIVTPNNTKDIIYRNAIREIFIPKNFINSESGNLYNDINVIKENLIYD